MTPTEYLALALGLVAGAAGAHAVWAVTAEAIAHWRRRHP